MVTDILVVGSGAREHALVWKLACSPHVRHIHVAPGNGGTALMAQNVPVAAHDIQGLVDAAQKLGVSLVVVGPEVPLVAGLVDECRRRGLRAFGPTAGAARIEGSKAYAKGLMRRCVVPTADFRVFEDYEAAASYVREAGRPLVVKADGLAGGKGAIVCDGPEDALVALEDVMLRQVFGPAGARVVVEERLYGREVSIMAFVSGDHVLVMAPACDYKRIGDGDTGPNTGGMGAYSPPPWLGSAIEVFARDNILLPIARGLKEDGQAFQGVLYAGLMVTEDGPKALEFNCRFGDPETQVVLPRLESDLYEVMDAVVTGNLDGVGLNWTKQAAVAVVLASQGYPGKYATGYPIRGLDQVEDGVSVFHAGTRLGRLPGWEQQASGGLFRRNKMIEADSFTGGIETDGGRVLTVVALGDDLESARAKVYRNVPVIRFENSYSRSDIASSDTVGEGAIDGRAAKRTGAGPEEQGEVATVEPDPAPEQP